MIRIGEAAKQFGISNRTLRHWEEYGNTEKHKNGKWIFITSDFNVATHALVNHLENLKQDTAILIAYMERLIVRKVLMCLCHLRKSGSSVVYMLPFPLR